ncbi:DMT family transporter [Halalkalirubrum salinum]|uniref:DMT family transporter n=1 Tax=Halalkalirubrum salinum TaxID=2563889 RepID=UPI001F0F6061|nr:EamA family transporter [Halalkalirubrum salinum]
MLQIVTQNLIQYRNLVLFALLSVFWGSSFVAISAGLETLPPLLFAAVRYDIAGAILLGYAIVAAEQWRPTSVSEWVLVTVGGLFVIGIHYALSFVGQTYVTSGVAAIVLSTTPILTPLFAWLLLTDERIGISGVIGTVVGLFGIVLIAAPEPGASEGTAIGVVLLVLSAASFAFGAVLLKRLPARMALAPSQAWMMLIGAAMLHGLSLGFGEPQFRAIAWTPVAVVSLAYLAIVASAIGFVIYFDLLDRIGAIEASLVNYAVPIVAAVVGWLLLGESITPATVLGFALIITGFVLVKSGRIFAGIVAVEARLSRGYAVEDEFLDAEAMASIEAPAFDDSRPYHADD